MGNSRLVRTGKVRNQTPKVHRIKLRKKKLQGRAKKRKIYNARFVNISNNFWKVQIHVKKVNSKIKIIHNEIIDF